MTCQRVHTRDMTTRTRTADIKATLGTIEATVRTRRDEETNSYLSTIKVHNEHAIHAARMRLHQSGYNVEQNGTALTV